MASSAELPDLGTRFVLRRQLGRGSSAVVYEAEDVTLGRTVAIKLLTADASEAMGTERFLREIRDTAGLVHPNIMPLYDSGTHDGRLFYVMPCVTGDTLRTLLDRRREFPIAEVIRIVADLAEALAYAHGQGLVHRDLKPENIFLHRGRALLADFGIARPVDGPHDRLTRTGMIVGTLAYLAPELLSTDAEVDPRSDLYALGCVTYELLAGTPPYPGPGALAFMAQHASSQIPDVRTLAPAVTASLAMLVTQLLAKRPADRPATSGAVLAALFATEHVAASPAPFLPPAGNDERTYNAASMAAHAEGRALFFRSYHGGPGSREKLEMTLALFERSQALDATNPYPLVGLADSHLVLGFRGFRPFDESSERAHSYRLQALALAPNLAVLHSSIAADLLYWKDDFDGAGEEFARAARQGIKHSEGTRLYGSWLKMAGRHEEALSHMRYVIEVDRGSAGGQIGLADVLMAMGRNVEALPPLQQALRLSPGYESALERLEIAYARLGNHDDALDARRAWLGHRQRADRIAAIDTDQATAGAELARRADLRRELGELLALAETEDPFVDLHVSRQRADYILLAYAALGEWSRAMDWVERGYRRRPGRLRRVLTDLPYDYRGLAEDPRFARLLRMAGLDELI